MRVNYFAMFVIGAMLAVIRSVNCTGPDSHRHPNPFERRELRTAIGVLRRDDDSTGLERTARNSFVVPVSAVVNKDDQVDSRCRRDLLLFDANRNNKENRSTSLQGSDWADQMYDAQGRLQAGLLQGHFFWLGDFWECLQLQVWPNETQVGDPDFTGKFCLTTTQILFLPMPVFKIGMCFPSTCSAKDLQLAASETFTFPFNTNFNDDFCQTVAHKPWDPFAIGSGVFFCFLFAVICIGSLLELALIAKRKLGPKTVNFDLGEKSDKQITFCSDGCSGSFGRELLLSFSVIRNLKQVFNTSRSGADLGAIHGMRTISMSWVVLGHTFLLLHHEFPWKNQFFATKFNKDFLTQAMLAGEFSVDTFFCMSGFLMTYLFMKEMKQKNGSFNVFQYVFHRLWRLTPAYAIVIMYMSGVYPEIGKGPMWPATTADRDVCRDKWWQNLLYINVYFDETVKCLPQAWYLCLDIVFYLVSPIILWPLHKKRIIGFAIFGAFTLIGFIAPAAIIYKDDLPAYPAWNADAKARDVFMHVVYDKAWCRISAYLVGMAYGYLYFLKGSTFKMHPLVVGFGWAAATAINLALTYGSYTYATGDTPMYTGMFVVYGTFTRPAWSVGVGWVIFACVTGYGGYVNSILSWKGFLPLSRLSYTMYLVHFTMIAQYYATRVESTYIDYYTMIYIGITMFLTSIVAGLLLSLAVESPCIHMEKLISRRGNSGSSAAKKSPGERPDYEPLLTAGSPDPAEEPTLSSTIANDGDPSVGRPPPPTRNFSGNPAKQSDTESINDLFYDPESDHVVSGYEDSFDDDDDDNDNEEVIAYHRQFKP